MAFKRIKDWLTPITAFRTGDVIPVDGPSGTAKMPKDSLIEIIQSPIKEEIKNQLGDNYFHTSGTPAITGLGIHIEANTIIDIYVDDISNGTYRLNFWGVKDADQSNFYPGLNVVDGHCHLSVQYSYGWTLRQFGGGEAATGNTYSVRIEYEGRRSAYNTLFEKIEKDCLNVKNGITAEFNNIENCFSNNEELNKIIAEAYVPDFFAYNGGSFTIRRAVLSTSNNKYYNMVRLYREPGNYDDYYNLFFKYYESQEEAAADCLGFDKIYSYDRNRIIFDLSGLNVGEQKTFSADFRNLSKIFNAPRIASELNTCEHKLTKAVDNQIGAVGSYQCEDQFKEGSLVKVFKDGLLCSPDTYTLYKQGKVLFGDTSDLDENTKVLFEYDKYSINGNAFENDLNENIEGFVAVQAGQAAQAYGFVSDPSGSDNDVIKISFTEEITGDRARLQLDKDLDSTEFEDEVEMYISQEMYDALITFPSTFNWFGFGSSWCPFGTSPVGSTTNMFSGQATGFNLSKPNSDSSSLYYFIQARQKWYNPNTGMEEYQMDPSKGYRSFYSEFPVKPGEWIKLRRKLVVGNPANCLFEVVDSDGTHSIPMNGIYTGVCDPENESTRYGNKVNPNIPYRMFRSSNFVKIYTSKEIADHCINTIGECSLYFKNYKLIKSKIVNAF